jgi:hypothetical protein
MTSTGGDLLSNFNLSGGQIGCHSAWDLVTTVTGDIALTRDLAENNRQRLLLWLATPKGERPDPSLGCCIHDYFHQKITKDLPRRLSLDMRADLLSVFPTLNIKNINVTAVTPLSGGNREIECDISLGDDSLQFLANFEALDATNEIINQLIYSGGT